MIKSENGYELEVDGENTVIHAPHGSLAIPRDDLISLANQLPPPVIKSKIPEELRYKIIDWLADTTTDGLYDYLLIKEEVVGGGMYHPGLANLKDEELLKELEEMLGEDGEKWNPTEFEWLMQAREALE